MTSARILPFIDFQEKSRTIVAVLTHHKAEIDADKLSWLRGFLRQHLSRAEYRIIAGVMGWSRPRRQSTDAAAAPSPGLADDIPF